MFTCFKIWSMLFVCLSLYRAAATTALLFALPESPLGLPPSRPLARAALRPACVHSLIRSLSNSARVSRIDRVIETF